MTWCQLYGLILYTGSPSYIVAYWRLPEEQFLIPRVIISLSFPLFDAAPPAVAIVPVVSQSQITSSVWYFTHSFFWALSWRNSSVMAQMHEYELTLLNGAELSSKMILIRDLCCVHGISHIRHMKKLIIRILGAGQRWTNLHTCLFWLRCRLMWSHHRTQIAGVYSFKPSSRKTSFQSANTARHAFKTKSLC